jgi:actin-like ATPase involved in cell morphogenesis
MSSGYAVGIDLGTSNTVAIVRWPDGRTRPVLFDGQPVLPSAVFLDHDGTLHVGRDAQRMAQLDPARYEPNPKRRIDEDVLFLGDRELPITEVLAAPLRAVARAVRDTLGHLPPAVITCPAAWGTHRRQRLQQAAAAAGWPPVTLMSEPIAAARYFTETLRQPVPPGHVLAIFDFGGGTLDVALVRNDGATFTVVGTGGAEDLGGLDIDAAIVNHLGQILAAQHPQVWAQISQPTDELARRNRRMFWDDARAAKEMLSRATTAPIAVPGVSASLHLTRDELEQLATPLLNRATGELTTALHRSGLQPDRLTGIFLVGGTSRVPLVSRLLHTYTGIAPTVLEQPELPVAEGAVAGAVAGVVAGVVAPAQRVAPAVPVQRGVPPVPAQHPAAASVTATSLSGGVPVSGVPSSGPPTAMPVSALPVSTLPGGPPSFPPPRGPGFPAPPPQPRRARRGRKWIWVALIMVPVLALGIVGTGYFVYNRYFTTTTLTAPRTTTIADLAPNGLRQAFSGETKAYAVGQHTDGTVEVVTIDLATGAERRYRSTVKAEWAGARILDTWIAVVSKPTADGKKYVELSNGVDDLHATLTLGKDDDVMLHRVDRTSQDLEYVVYSPGANTMRTAIAGKTPKDGTPAALPPGARLLSDLRVPSDKVGVLNKEGVLYTYEVYNGKVAYAVQKAPPATPANLLFVNPKDNSLAYTEDKLEYQVVRDGVPELTRGPANRKPLWLGNCNYGLGMVCVIDQVGDDASTREIATFGADKDIRAKVPFARLPDAVAEGSRTPFGWLLVTSTEGDAAYTTTVDVLDGTAKKYGGQLWALGNGHAVYVPGTALTPQKAAIVSIYMGDDGKTKESEETVRPGTCHGDFFHLACAVDGDSFTVWKVNKS